MSKDRELLQEARDCLVAPAGMTSDIVRDKAKFAQFLKASEEKVKSLVARIDGRLAEPQGDAGSVEDKLTAQGVFKGAHGLEGLADCDAFWEAQPYGTRLYYGDGGAEYLHRGVLKAAIAALRAEGTQDALKAGDCEWTPQPEHEPELWESDCGQAWCFIEGGPKENNVRFCHGCGKPVALAASQRKEG